MNVDAPYFKIESFGAVDGPGIRLVIFLQGCPLRCIYCHNPESWSNRKHSKISTQEVIDKFRKNKKFYQHGGITLSGGEPLIHQHFCLELAKLCFENNINLALDTSGVTFSKANFKFYKKIIQYHPLWIVDIKHINSKKHKLITGCSTQNELMLIKFLEKNKQLFWIRQVLVPGYTDDPKDLRKVGKFIKQLKYLDKFEILPYHRLALSKYRQLNIVYHLLQIKEPTKQMIDKVKKLINSQ